MLLNSMWPCERYRLLSSIEQARVRQHEWMTVTMIVTCRVHTHTDNEVMHSSMHPTYSIKHWSDLVLPCCPYHMNLAFSSHGPTYNAYAGDITLISSNMFNKRLQRRFSLSSILSCFECTADLTWFVVALFWSHVVLIVDSHIWTCSCTQPSSQLDH